MNHFRTSSVGLLLMLCGGLFAAEPGNEVTQNMPDKKATTVSSQPLTYRRFLVEDKDGRVIRTTPVSDVPEFMEKWLKAAEPDDAEIPDEFIPRWARGVSQIKNAK